MKNLKYYCAIMKEDIEKDKARDETISDFRDMLACEWESGTDLSTLPWWQDVVNSAPADSCDAAIRTFSNIMPSTRVFPSNASPGEKKRVESIEDALMWHFNKANQRASRRPLERILDSVVKVGGVGMQVRYLPFDLKGRNDARSKALLRQGDFAYRIHDFETVHARESDEGLESITLAKLMTLADLIRLWGKDNPGIAKIIELARTDKTRTQADLEKTLVNYYEFTDYDVVVRCASISSGSLDDRVTDTIEILREEHKLPFLPWVYKRAAKPMLQTLVDSGAWERQNEMESLQRSIALSVAAHPGYWTRTMSGDGKIVDMTDPGGQVPLGPNEEMGAIPERRADPELMRATQDGNARLSQQLNTRALQYATEIASTAPFATFSAIMQTTIASLSLMTQVAESALEEAFYQELHWIKFSGIPLTGQRLRNRKNLENMNDMSTRKGSFVTIGNPGSEEDTTTIDYSPDALTIQVKLNPDTPTDKQSRQTQAVWYHDRLGCAWEDAMENAGLTDVERDEMNWAIEQFTQASIQRDAKLIVAEADLKIMQAQTQIQMQAQQAQMEQAQQAQQQQAQAQQPQGMEAEQMAMNQGGAFEMAQGQSPNSGGQPAAMVAPQMTREAGTGRTTSHVEERI